ncbi:MAG: hypothetical protein IK081_13375 [Lachnospiraceae bacterium]|nr:hypothetical protein [Lachnospiraceae bacterium]
MKNYVKQYQIYLSVILGVFFCSAFSLSFIPWINRFPENVETKLAYCIASVFWLGLILGLVMVGLMNGKMRRARAKVYSSRKMKRPRHSGFFTFSKEPWKLAIYFVICTGIVLSIADLVKTFIPTKIMFPIISVTYFAMVLHGIVDGKNFKVFQMLKSEG